MEDAGLNDASIDRRAAWLRAECETTSECSSILVVEDDDDIRDLLTTILTFDGYDVSAFSSAESALDALRDREFDFLLTDYALPVRSGAWLLSQAASEGLLDNTPVLVVTAHPDPAGVEGFDVIEKPFDVDDLLQRVRRLSAGRFPAFDRTA